MTTPSRLRRAAMACIGLLAGLLVAGCASSPPTQLVQLRLPAMAASATTTTLPGPWAVGPVSVPEYLDRASLVRRRGAAGLQALEGHRWAEPLADAVPRVLRQALASRLGADQVWPMPAPAGVRAARQLRVELLRLDADDDALVLQARWSLHGLPADAAPRVRIDEIRVPLATRAADTLAAAHGVALDRLAAAIIDAAR